MVSGENDGVQGDLTYIHDAGYTDFVRKAAALLGFILVLGLGRARHRAGWVHSAV